MRSGGYSVEPHHNEHRSTLAQPQGSDGVVPVRPRRRGAGPTRRRTSSAVPGQMAEEEPPRARGRRTAQDSEEQQGQDGQGGRHHEVTQTGSGDLNALDWDGTEIAGCPAARRPSNTARCIGADHGMRGRSRNRPSQHYGVDYTTGACDGHALAPAGTGVRNIEHSLPRPKGIFVHRRSARRVPAPAPAAGFPLAVLYKYVDDNGGYLAALITYYAFVSLFPLLLLLSTVLGFVLAGDPRPPAAGAALGPAPVPGRRHAAGEPSGIGGGPSAGRRHAGLAVRRARCGPGAAVRDEHHLGGAAQQPPQPVQGPRPQPAAARPAGVAVLGHHRAVRPGREQRRLLGRR